MNPDGTIPKREGAPDIEAMRRELARKVEAFLRDWRRCKRPACKRKRGCVPPSTGCCAELPPRRVVTEEQWEKVKLQLQRGLRKRLAEIREQEAAASQPPRRR